MIDVDRSSEPQAGASRAPLSETEKATHASWAVRGTLVGVLVLAGLLRLYGIGFGLPHLYHWDEKMYFHGAFFSWASGGATESLVYGNVPYLLLPIFWLMALLRGLPLNASGESALISQYLTDPTPFYIVGRVIWVALQVLAVLVCYHVASTAISRRAGLLSALFLAIAFLSVSEGHYVKGDSTAMLGALLAAAACLQILKRPTVRWYLAAGTAVGLSIAFKPYTYTLAALPVLAHMLIWRSVRRSIRRFPLLVVSGVSAIAALLITLPAPLLDPSGTWKTFLLESPLQLASVPTDGHPIWLYYWTGHLLQGAGWPLELLGLAGFVLWAARRDPARIVLLAVPLLLWIGIVSRANGFARYALPIVPFLCMGAGQVLDSLAARLMSGRGYRLSTTQVGALLAVLAVVAGLPSLLNDVRFGAYTSAPDTRTRASQWVEANIPAGSSIVEEGGQGFEAMSTLGPPLRASSASVGKAWAPTSLRPPTEFWTRPLLTWLDTYTPTYSLTFAATLTRRAEITTTAQWGDPDAFVMIGWRSNPEKNTPASPFWDDLHAKYALAARFDCSPCLPDDPYAWAVDYPSLAKVDPFSGATVAGPTVWVYKRK